MGRRVLRCLTQTIAEGVVLLANNMQHAMVSCKHRLGC
jgi:hypothetical protein